jgi:hypothetical protein
MKRQLAELNDRFVIKNDTRDLYEINTQILLPDNVTMKDDDEVEETLDAVVNFCHFRS